MKSGIVMAQIFGDKHAVIIMEQDRISALEFNEDNKMIAVGDKGGRVIIFENKSESGGAGLFSFYHEYQSHEAEFDYLKSLDISESINMIKFLPRTGIGHHLLSTNDKTIKLYRILEEEKTIVTNLNLGMSGKISESLNIPKITKEGSRIKSSLIKTFGNGHAYNINSISLSADQTIFLSSDNLRINIWNFEYPEQTFVIVDTKPSDVSIVSEVISTSSFHPTSCNLFAYAISTGKIHISDLRTSAITSPQKTLIQNSSKNQSDIFFSEIFKNISDIQFHQDNYHLAARDFNYLRIWDLRMDKNPQLEIPVHSFPDIALYDLYEMDHVYDRFSCSFNNDFITTGSYDHYFYSFNWKEYTGTLIDINETGTVGNTFYKIDSKNLEYDTHTSDFSQKILNVKWGGDYLAVAATNMLYIYKSCL